MSGIYFCKKSSDKAQVLLYRWLSSLRQTTKMLRNVLLVIRRQGFLQSEARMVNRCEFYSSSIKVNKTKAEQTSNEDTLEHRSVVMETTDESLSDRNNVDLQKSSLSFNNSQTDEEITHFQEFIRNRAVDNNVTKKASALPRNPHPVTTETSLLQGADYENESHLVQSETGLSIDTAKPVQIKPYQPVFNLAALIYESNTLQNLVKLGVNLSALEKYPEIAEHIMKLDFERDVKPYLLFLKDNGVVDYGIYLTKNPWIFKQSLEDLQVRINYLESKKFDRESINTIVTKAPLFLSLGVKTVDQKLGFLQRSFNLTGNEVRSVALHLPKIITWKQEKIKDNKFYIKEFLGFTNVELKKILMSYPKVFIMDKYAVGKKFDFLYNVMGLKHNRLLEFPSIFSNTLKQIKNRHRYLLKVGRAQYDPVKEHYVSLKALTNGNDSVFCMNVAKTSVREYNNFLKCI